MATLAGQSLLQPSVWPQKVQVLQPLVCWHCLQQSAALYTTLVGELELTSNTIVSPATFCCARRTAHGCQRQLLGEQNRLYCSCSAHAGTLLLWCPLQLPEAVMPPSMRMLCSSVSMRACGGAL